MYISKLTSARVSSLCEHGNNSVKLKHNSQIVKNYCITIQNRLEKVVSIVNLFFSWYSCNESSTLFSNLWLVMCINK